MIPQELIALIAFIVNFLFNLGILYAYSFV